MDKQAEKFLRVACDLGTVVIVTNETVDWVDTTSMEMPLVRQVLWELNVGIISAREQWKCHLRELEGTRRGPVIYSLYEYRKPTKVRMEAARLQGCSQNVSERCDGE